MRKINFICKQCGKEFIRKAAHKDYQPLFCSHQCYGKSIAHFKKCLQCGKSFYNYMNKFFCSMGCAGKFKRGKKFSSAHRESLSRARTGRFQFEKHPQWKGDDVGYGALHEWVYRVLGSPMVCEKCNSKKANNKEIHWANKSGKYLRDKTDWMRLCVKCHKNHDIERLKNNAS